MQELSKFDRAFPRQAAHGGLPGVRRAPEYIEGRHWAREAKKCGLAPRVALERVKVLAEAIQERLADARAAVAAMSAGDHPMLDEVEKAIRSRCGSILKTLDR